MDRRKRRNPWAIVLLILVLCFGVAYGCASLGTRIFASNHFGQTKTVDIANLQGLNVVADGFVYYDGSTISHISSDGDAGWSYLVGANAGFNASNYGIAVWQQNTLTLIDSDTGETTFTGAMEANVISACIDDHYAAVLIGTETSGTMILMESDGRQVSQIILNDVTVIDFGFFSNGSLLWVMLLDSNGTAPTCDIQTYRPGKEIVGSIHDNEQLSYAVMFQSNQVLVAGDTYLRTYDYTGTEDASLRRLIYGWYLASSDSNATDPLMAFVNDAQLQGNSSIRDLRLVRTNYDRVLRLPFGCMDVLSRGDIVYGFSDDGHLVLASTSQVSPTAYQLNLQHIETVYGMTNDNVAILGNGDSVYLVSLK